MKVDDNICKEHSGCLADIENLRASEEKQWAALGDINKDLRSFSTRMNVVLGGVAVSCILLGINIALGR